MKISIGDAAETRRGPGATTTVFRCTICGKKCPMTTLGYSQYARHVYGLFSEPRCSERCAWKPVVDVRAQRQLERMGHIVVQYRVEHGLRIETGAEGQVTLTGGLPATGPQKQRE